VRPALLSYAEPSTPRVGRWAWFKRFEWLINTVLVLLILATLAGIVLPKYHGCGGISPRRLSILKMQAFASAVRRFEADTGRFPAEEEGLAALVTAPAGAGGWKGAYVTSTRVFTDPWGNPFLYLRCEKDGVAGFGLICASYDGTFHTPDDMIVMHPFTAAEPLATSLFPLFPRQAMARAVAATRYERTR
jgi:general secretion pathway protein G